MAAAAASASTGGRSIGGPGSMMSASTGSLPKGASGSPTQRKPTKKQAPGTRWNGKVNGLSLQEYREMKWTLEASYGFVSKNSPSYSCRGHFKPPRSKSDVLLNPNPMEALNKLNGTGPAYTLGASPFVTGEVWRSPGPQYALPSTLDPVPHPTTSKHCGARFGTETIIHRDPDGVCPGPGEHNIMEASNKSSTHPTPPNFKIQGREAWRESSLKMPGPDQGEYDLKANTQRGAMNTRSYTMLGKGEPLEKPRGSRRNVHAGFIYNVRPMPVDAKDNVRNEFISKPKSPNYSFSRDSRGIA